MEKVKEMTAKAKDAVSGNKSHDNTSHHTGPTGTTGTTTHTGPHSSGMMNQADPRVDSDRDASRNMGAASHGPGGHTTTAGAHGGAGLGTTGHTGNTTTDGPHNSNLMNKMDPRVDSDRDASRNMGAAQYGAGGHTGTTHTAGGLGGGHTGHTSTTTHTGPHSSGMMNQADPRVDSDRDASRNMGMASHGPGGHTTTTTTAGGLGGGRTGHTGNTTTDGPHNSNLMNKMDPRVDSDRDASRNMGAAQYGAGGHTGTTHTAGGVGGHTGTTHTGPHSSGMMNQADPRVDSDRDASRNMGAASHGPGGHTTTTGNTHTAGHTGSTNHGPHSSNLLNKLDPRVDSDLDGSKTVGNAGRGV